MKVTSVSINNSNTLSWCLANHAELKDNMPVVSIINDETFFIVRVEGVDFYQMFRLTQHYRNQLKVCDVQRAAIPSDQLLSEYFPKNEETVKNMLSLGTGIVTQMLADGDIIYPEIPKLFLPMITTTFTVQFPFSFVDAIAVMTEKEVNDLFTDQYIENLAQLPEQGAAHSLIRSILIIIERATTNIKYDQKYEQLLRATKYFPLSQKSKSTQPYRYGMLSFARYDPINRWPVQCSMFKPVKAQMIRDMTRMKTLTSPTEFSFAIQLPIYHMQLLESRYFPDELKITHRSSINSIFDNGDELDDLRLGDNGETIDNYRVRLSEAQFVTMNTIIAITNSDTDFHPSATFALLSPLYRTNAVITFSEDVLSMLRHNNDTVLDAMFEEIATIVDRTVADLNR